MARVQLALNVDDLDQAIAFYSKLFNTEPAKRKPGYANFAIADPPLKLVLLENPGQGGTLNHLGVEVESSEVVHAEIARLTKAEMFTEEEIGTTCCFATQDKVWVTGPSWRDAGRSTPCSPIPTALATAPTNLRPVIPGRRFGSTADTADAAAATPCCS